MNAQPHLSPQQWRILEFLAQVTDWCTRQDMYAFVGTEKGYSKALGAPTGRHHPNSLEALGLVERRDPKPFGYRITPEGRRVIELHLSATPARNAQPDESIKADKVVSRPMQKRSPMVSLRMEQLEQLARSAVGCTFCFATDREMDWGHVPRRPHSRPDDVPVAPWIGPQYAESQPRVVVMMLNPGHAQASHKETRKNLNRDLRHGKIRYQEYNARLTPLVKEWGFGKVVRWLRGVGLQPEKIAFLNAALCAVADDGYFPDLFSTCLKRHTVGFVRELQPDIVLLCGKDLSPYKDELESAGAQVLLTWHYRPMDTTAGQAELRRVCAELERLG